MTNQITILEAPATQLSMAEQQALVQYEAVVEQGLDTFVAVGNALISICSQRLYRATHQRFEDYCFERFQLDRTYAYRLMDAAQVVADVSPIGNTRPKNEAQARPLARLETPEERQAAWLEIEQTAPGGKITAKHADQVVRRRQQRQTVKISVETRPREQTGALHGTIEPEAISEAMQSWRTRAIDDISSLLDYDVVATQRCLLLWGARHIPHLLNLSADSNPEELISAAQSIADTDLTPLVAELLLQLWIDEAPSECRAAIVETIGLRSPPERSF